MNLLQGTLPYMRRKDREVTYNTYSITASSQMLNIHTFNRGKFKQAVVEL